MRDIPAMQHKDNKGRNTESENCLKLRNGEVISSPFLSIFTSDKRIKQLNIFFVGARPLVNYNFPGSMPF